MLKQSICLFSALFMLSGEAQALEGCFCAKDNPAVIKCGEVLRFDPSDSVTLREYVPLNSVCHWAAPVTLSFLDYTECSVPPALCTTVGPIEPPPPPPPPPPVQGETFGVAGSNTIGESLMPALIKGFAELGGYTVRGGQCNAEIRLEAPQSDAHGITIRCEARGTGTGIPALAEKEADIAMLSRPITETEQNLMRLRGFPKMTSVPFESVIGLDGLRIVVSPRNWVDVLSLDQIAQIFSGEITDWSEVGGRAGAINLYVRDTKSGTRDSFEHLVMAPRNRTIAAHARNFESSGALSNAVENDPGGIGFIGFAYSGGTKALAINEACGIQHEPAMFTIKTEDYPLARRLFLYKSRPQSGFAEALVSYALSEVAQSVIERAGYVNQAIESWSAGETRGRILNYANAPTQELGLDVDRGYLASLLQEMDGARRLSISFHFRFGSDELDTKALDDAIRLARYLNAQSRRGQKLLLLGFADSVGSFRSNFALSENRAKSVRDALFKTGANLDASAIIAKGYSELMPVACNGSDLGRQKNRRVEVYLLD